MIEAIGVILFIYLIFNVILIVGLRKVESSISSEIELPKITVLVAFRNEANNLPDLLQNLSRIQYPDKQLEIILVNDHSTDDSYSVVENHKLFDTDSVRLISLDQESGKKSAIVKGITEANSELILTTDADCSFNELWVKTMVKKIIASEARMVLGAVKIENGGNFIQNLQALDLSILMGITKSTAALHSPILSNAANCLFYREDFLNLAPYKSNYKVSSGDDIFFLHAMKINNRKIVFNSEPKSLVLTKGKSSLLGFIEQRVRWASKSRYYKDSTTLIFGAWLMVFNVLFSFAFIWALINIRFLPFLFGALIIKWIIELMFLQSIPTHLKPQNFVVKSLLFSFVYPVYSVGIALLSLFYKPQWKGRKI